MRKDTPPLSRCSKAGRIKTGGYWEDGGIVEGAAERML